MIVAYVDGEEKYIEDDWADVSVQFDDPYERAYRDAEDENAPDPEKYVEEHVNKQAPEAWCNGAGVRVRDDDIQVWVSTGDPRGAFALTLYRTKDGEIRLELPHENMSLPHEELERVNDGLLVIKRTKKD